MRDGGTLQTNGAVPAGVSGALPALSVAGNRPGIVVNPEADIPRFLGQFAGVLILIGGFQALGFLIQSGRPHLMRDGLLEHGHAERGEFPWDHDADRWACGGGDLGQHLSRPARCDAARISTDTTAYDSGGETCVSRISAGHRRCWLRAEFRNGSCSASGDGWDPAFSSGVRGLLAYSDSRFGFYLRRSDHYSGRLRLTSTQTMVLTAVRDAATRGASPLFLSAQGFPAEL